MRPLSLLYRTYLKTYLFICLRRPWKNQQMNNQFRRDCKEVCPPEGLRLRMKLITLQANLKRKIESQWRHNIVTGIIKAISDYCNLWSTTCCISSDALVTRPIYRNDRSTSDTLTRLLLIPHSPPQPPSETRI
jgi:hypothetical protein